MKPAAVHVSSVMTRAGVAVATRVVREVLDGACGRWTAQRDITPAVEEELSATPLAHQARTHTRAALARMCEEGELRCRVLSYVDSRRRHVMRIEYATYERGGHQPLGADVTRATVSHPYPGRYVVIVAGGVAGMRQDDGDHARALSEAMDSLQERHEAQARPVPETRRASA